MTTHLLYDGALALDYNDDKHQYRVNGALVPSVTGILEIIAKPALLPWALKMAGEYLAANLMPGMVVDEVAAARLVREMKSAHRRKTDTAADVGTIVHKFAEDFILGREPPPPTHSQAKAAAEAFLGWLLDHHVKVLHAERKIYSRQHNYAGTMDLEAEIDGALCRVDFKSSNSIYPEYFLQLAGYDLARAEETGTRADKRIILRFPKDGGPCQTQDAIDPFHDDAGFLAALALFRWQKQVKENAA